MSNDNELLQHFHLKALGKEAERFMRSSVGQYLLAQAEEKINIAVEGLKTCDPEDTKAVRNFQNEIAVAESVVLWLEAIITEGASAENILEERLS